MKYVIVYGNPFDGLRLEGPFDSADEAESCADRSKYQGDWLVTELDEPDEN